MKRLQNKSNLDTVRSYLNNERPFTQVGYVGDINKYLIRKEGETWTDSGGKNWIQTKSGPQTVTPLMDMIREETNDKCVKCEREIRWGNKYDRKMFNKTSKCFDCLVEEETQLRIKGQFKLYETRKLLENEVSYLKDIKQKLKESKEYLKTEQKITFVNSNGMVEEWTNDSKTALEKSVQKDWVTCLKKIATAETELKKVNDEISRVLEPA